MKEFGQPGSRELRRLLIDAALRILADPETPLDLRKIAEAAGKSRTAPYLVFGKEKEGGGLSALRLAVAAEGTRMLTIRMDIARRSTDDARLAFSRMTEALLRFATQHERLFRLMFGPEIGSIPVSKGMATQRHPEFRNLVRARLRAEQVVLRAIEKAQSQRMLPGGDPLQLTMGAWALMIGTAFLLLDRVLGAAGMRTSAETAAAVATGILMGSAAEPVTRAALALLAAQMEQGKLPLDDTDVLPHLAESASDILSAYRPMRDAERLGVTGKERRFTVRESRLPYDRAARAIARYPALRRAALVAPALEGARLLWIDDNPAGNTWERATFEALNVEVTTAGSTEEAVHRLSVDSFDVIISDISRDGDHAAGLTALPQLQEIAPDTPVLFYVGRADPARRAPEGALGLTDRPDELLHLVLDVLERRRL